MTDADHWVEVLRCPRCKNTGDAELSEIGSYFDVKVDSVPEGFVVRESEYGINFYCSSCDCPVEL
jgi:hypothetical protein